MKSTIDQSKFAFDHIEKYFRNIIHNDKQGSF